MISSSFCWTMVSDRSRLCPRPRRSATCWPRASPWRRRRRKRRRNKRADRVKMWNVIKSSSAREEKKKSKGMVGKKKKKKGGKDKQRSVTYCAHWHFKLAFNQQVLSTLNYEGENKSALH